MARKNDKAVKRPKKVKGESNLACLYNPVLSGKQTLAGLVEGQGITQMLSGESRVSAMASEISKQQTKMLPELMVSYYALNSKSISGMFEYAPLEDRSAMNKQKTLLRERLERTLKRLRQKGYCNEATFDSLSDKINEMSPSASACMAVLPPEFNMFRVNRYHTDRTIRRYGDEIWMQSIEMACLLTKPDFVENMENISLIRLAETILPQIYCIFFLLVLVSTFNVSELLKTEVENSEKKARTIISQAENEAKKVDSIIKNADNRVASANKQVEQLQKEKRELEKEMYELQREVAWRRMLAEISEADDEDPEVEDEQEVDNKIDIPEEEIYKDIEVPEDDGIVFLGGHTNWVKKVRQLHPNWKYVSTDNQRNDNVLSVVRGNIKCVIFYWKHISHPMYNTLMNAIGPDTPIIYLNNLNLEMMEHTIRKEYANQVLGLSKEDLIAQKGR